MSFTENNIFENHKNKCRCCLHGFEEEEKGIKITEIVEIRFQELTQIELKKDERYSGVICEQCYSELCCFSLLRKKLVRKQKGLYEFVDSIAEELKHSEQDVPVTNEREENPSQDLEFKVETEEYMFNDVIIENRLEEVEQIPKSQPPKSKRGVSVRKDTLKRHNDVVHVKVKRFFCDLCDYRAFGKQHLEKHMIKHVPKEFRKGFNCPDCNETFTSPSNLEYHKYAKHAKISNKSGSFCHICEKQYSTRSNLKVHLKSHSGPEFHCDFEGCRSSFTTKKGLSRHKKTHLDQRESHRCKLCAKSYFRVSDLNRHIAVVHDRVRFNCVVNNCSYSAGYKGQIKMHIISTHRDLPENKKKAYLSKISDNCFQKDK